MIVLKFGGTSVANPDNIRKVLAILLDYHQSGKNFLVCVSAMSGITNQLIDLAKAAEKGNEQYRVLFQHIEEQHFNAVKALVSGQNQSDIFLSVKQMLNDLEDVVHGVYLLRELSNRAMDFIVSHGERLNATIISGAAREQGLASYYVDAREIIKTDSKFGSAKVNFELTYALVQAYFEDLSRGIPIVTGFVASNDEGKTTTLGRGGSDYTASIIAAALKADSVEIWTDVDGVLTTDPRKVKDAFPLKALSYQEAMELSHFGAKVIYPPTLQPVFANSIPIYIKNTFNPGFEGTLISNLTEDVNDHSVKGISSINDIVMINIQGSGMVGVAGTSSRIFKSLASKSINIILITQASSEHSICIAIAPEEASSAKSILEEEFYYELADGKLDPIIVERGLSIVALIGDNMANVPGVAGRMFTSLGMNGINIRAIAQGSSERNISVVISQEKTARALNALHDNFFLSDTQTIHMFMVGHGLVGQELLSQMSSQLSYLLKERHIRIVLVGISNSKRMTIEPEGIPIDGWREYIESHAQPADIQSFVDQMIALNMPNSVFVDNTANMELPKIYERILNENIHIVTPNKMATSGKYKDYKHLKSVANRKGVQFLFETNVGAGLPVISTLKDLIQSGDIIEKIEGVFSGTLSYIFNHYDGNQSFASVVREAQRLGYTEPDPREDLNGKDVARKILILSREAGYDLEPDDVIIEPILPASCFEAATVEAFYESLEHSESVFKSMAQEARNQGKKLRVVASLIEGRAKIALDYFGPEHPFYGLSGSDNMIAYTTARYLYQPLVVRGPGAGAAVTAAGVFSDIIRTSRR